MINILARYMLIVVCSIMLLTCKSDLDSAADAGVPPANLCKEATYKVENCLGLERGALSYVDLCGEKEVSDVRNIETCSELINYLGVNK